MTWAGSRCWRWASCALVTLGRAQIPFTESWVGNTFLSDHPTGPNYNYLCECRRTSTYVWPRTVRSTPMPPGMKAAARCANSEQRGLRPGYWLLRECGPVMPSPATAPTCTLPMNGRQVSIGIVQCERRQYQQLYSDFLVVNSSATGQFDGAGGQQHLPVRERSVQIAASSIQCQVPWRRPPVGRAPTATGWRSTAAAISGCCKPERSHPAGELL